MSRTDSLPYGKVRGILFDLDGVLGKLHVLVQSAVQLMNAFGGELTEDAFCRDLAAGRVKCLWRYVASSLEGQGREVRWEVVRDKEASLYFGNGAQPGLMEHETLLIDRALLHRASERFPLGVITSRPRDRTEAFFTQVGLDASSLFRIIVTRDDVGDDFIKPHKKPVAIGVTELNLGRRARALFLDDSPSGIIAGSGLTIVVGIADPRFRSTDSLRAAGAHAVWDHPDRLGEHLPLNG